MSDRKQSAIFFRAKDSVCKFALRESRTNMEKADLQKRLQQHLEERQLKGNYRKLSTGTFEVDFLSNDYLGLARCTTLQEQIQAENEAHWQGSTGSRLLSGNSAQAEKLEEYLADIFAAESCLLFNSGYAANLGLLSALPQKGDTILYDELSHSSIKDGMRLSFARRFSFRHNDLKDLENKLQRASGVPFVIVESIYSMDGDQAPLQQIADLCRQYQAQLIVDEAHSTGIYGNNGSGLCTELGITDQLFARVHTFGKAMGSHGACVAGSKLLTDYLTNFARSFIYTTAMPPHSLSSIQASFEFLQTQGQRLQTELCEKIAFFNQLFEEKLSDFYAKVNSQSPIQAILISGNEKARAISQHLQSSGYNIRPILSPTVKVGQERIRICLHTYNTKKEIGSLIEKLKIYHQNEQEKISV
jgi:8-amino-7-oxononanoate synthase